MIVAAKEAMGKPRKKWPPIRWSGNVRPVSEEEEVKAVGALLEAGGAVLPSSEPDGGGTAPQALVAERHRPDAGNMLLPRLARGEPGAMEDVIERYGPMIRGIIGKRIHDLDDRDEAVQVAYVMLLSASAKYDPNRGPEGMFIATVAKFAVGRIRQQIARRNRLALVDPLDAAFALDAVERGRPTADASDVLDAFEKLDPELRATLFETVIEGTHQTKVAARRGVSCDRISRLRRLGLDKLRAELDGSSAESRNDPQSSRPDRMKRRRRERRRDILLYTERLEVRRLRRLGCEGAELQRLLAIPRSHQFYARLSSATLFAMSYPVEFISDFMEMPRRAVVDAIILAANAAGERSVYFFRELVDRRGIGDDPKAVKQLILDEIAYAKSASAPMYRRAAA